jgi:hypothetical protein
MQVKDSKEFLEFLEAALGGKIQVRRISPSEINSTRNEEAAVDNESCSGCLGCKEVPDLPEEDSYNVFEGLSKESKPFPIVDVGPQNPPNQYSGQLVITVLGERAEGVLESIEEEIADVFQSSDTAEIYISRYFTSHTMLGK